MSDPGDGDGQAGGDGTRRGGLRVVRALYLVALGGLLVYLVVTRRDELLLLTRGARPGWLVAALVLATGQLLPSTLVWTVTVRHLDGPLRTARMLRVTALSLPARYLPGSVWYAVGRGVLLRRDDGVPGRVVATAAVIETALTVVVATLLAVALLPFGRELGDAGASLAAAVAAGLVVSSPPVLNRALAVLARRRGGDLVRLDWSLWSRAAGLVVLHWVWSSTTFVVYVHAFPSFTQAGVLEVVAAFLAAWVVGFVAVFAPQGAGVFETAVAALLVRDATAAAALVAAGYRGIVLVRDVLAFTVVSVAGGQRARR